MARTCPDTHGDPTTGWQGRYITWSVTCSPWRLVLGLVSHAMTQCE
nr:hypothetical protein [Kibdelosporangium sp. MJ126-NF4]